MPQGPIQTFDFTDGTTVAFNVNQPKVIKAGGGMIASINVVTPGTGVGTVYDTNSTANCTTANAVCPIPDTAGGLSIGLGIPVKTGITVQPGAGQMITVVYR
jgi:hypothetical protein